MSIANQMNPVQPFQIKEVRKFTSDITPFANVIYNNFKYISQFPELNHNVEEIKNLLTNNKMMGLLIYNKKSIIGYLVGEYKILNDGRSVYYVEYMYISPKYRNRKLGTQLMNILNKKCKLYGVKYITLTCDSMDRKVYTFYTKRGFKMDHYLNNNSRHRVLTCIV